jgi:hypothetical protein
VSPEPAETPGFFRFLPKVIKDWSTLAAIGTFLLYLFGYLSLRFHITAMGVDTDLSALDERYLFAGARFLVFLGNCVPYLALGLGVCWLAWKGCWTAAPEGFRLRLKSPAWLAASGLVIALLLVVLVMRDCFVVIDHPLPFLHALPGPSWLNAVLLDDGILKTWYFTGLLLATAVVVGLLTGSIRMGLRTPVERALAGSLSVMAILMVLLLPVNFGAVIMPYTLDRTTAIGKTALAPGQEAWILWEGKDWVTYLVRNTNSVSLVATPWKVVEKLEVLGSDSLLDIVLHSGVPGGPAGAGSDQTR